MLENLSPPTETESPLGMVDEPRDSIQGDETALINTLACGPPKYITDGAGRPRKSMLPILFRAYNNNEAP